MEKIESSIHINEKGMLDEKCRTLRICGLRIPMYIKPIFLVEN